MSVALFAACVVTQLHIPLTRQTMEQVRMLLEHSVEDVLDETTDPTHVETQSMPHDEKINGNYNRVLQKFNTYFICNRTLTQNSQWYILKRWQGKFEL